jgi:hypothetical protein
VADPRSVDALVALVALVALDGDLLALVLACAFLAA